MKNKTIVWLFAGLGIAVIVVIIANWLRSLRTVKEKKAMLTTETNNLMPGSNIVTIIFHDKRAEIIGVRVNDKYYLRFEAPERAFVGDRISFFTASDVKFWIAKSKVNQSFPPKYIITPKIANPIDILSTNEYEYAEINHWEYSQGRLQTNARDSMRIDELSGKGE